MSRRLSAIALVALLMVAIVPAPAQATMTLLRPDPLVSGTFFGHGGLSTDAWAGTSSGTLQAEVPAGSTVYRAWLYAAGTPSTPPVATVHFAGQDVSMTTINQDEGGSATRADVTDIVVSGVTSEGGVFDFAVDMPAAEGVALAVVYENASEPERTIAILDGGSLPTGDSATFGFAQALDTSIDGFSATLALGITFSYQDGFGTHTCGSGQVSNVDINGSRLSSCAGNADDSEPTAGGLITMGGVGDDLSNPPDPNGPGGNDDELYDLTPYLHDGDTELTVATVNPSNDDYIFFAGITITARASVATTGSPTISSIADQTIDQDTSTGALDFTVDDAETAATDLEVTAISSNHTLVRDADVVLGGSGGSRTVTVTPQSGESGTTTIALTVTDGDSNSTVSTFTVTVEAVSAPTAHDDTASTAEDTALSGASVLANDEGTGLTASLDGDVSHGTLNLADDGTYDYTPDPDWNGIDSFTYIAVQGALTSDPATVEITVTPVNDAPVAYDDTAAAVSGAAPAATSIAVLDNDEDVDEDVLTITDVSTPDHGMAVIDGDQVAYTPDADYVGADQFSYTIEDPDGASDTATVDVTVTTDGDTTPPVVSGPVARFLKGTPTRNGTTVRFTWPAATDDDGVATYEAQLRTDTGAWTSVSGAIVGRHLDLRLDLHHAYRLRIRATDTLGNMSGWVSGPRLAVKSKETPSFSFTKRWHIAEATSSSGTGYRWTTAKGAKAIITVTGRSFAWLAPVNRRSGRAAIYVDGVKVKTVTLYSKTAAKRRVVWSIGFDDDAPHRIVIKNLATGGHPRISLDAIWYLS